MSRLIDADALEAVVLRLNEKNWGITRVDYKLIDRVISEFPTIEPEPHFCRDCKWVTYHGSVDKHGTVEALWHCHNWDGGTDEEGFCHEWERGERDG